MKLSIRKGWVLAAAMGAAAALLLVWGGGARTALAQTANEHYVDVDPSTTAIETVITQPLGVPFLVNIVVDQETGADSAGYQFKMSANRAVLAITGGAALGTYCTGTSICAPAGPVIQNAGGAQDPGGAPLYDRSTIFAGETIVSGPNSTNEGAVYEVELTCIGPGTGALDLRPLPVDGLGQATQMLGSTGTGGDVTFDAGVAGAVDDPGIICEPQADLWIMKTHLPDEPLAGETLTYTITVKNEGPNAAYAVGVTDTLDEMKTYVDDTSPYGCEELPISIAPPGTFLCPMTDPTNPMDTLAAGAMVQFDIVVTVDLLDAGKVNENAVIVQSVDPSTMTPVTTDPNQHPAPILDDIDFAECLMDRLSDPDPVNPASDVCDNVWMDLTQVQPADVSIVKSADKAIYSEGEEILWDIVATVNGPSPASDVVLSDTVGANQEITYCFAVVTPPPPDAPWPCTCVIAVDLKSCDCDCTGMPIEAGGVIGMAVDADVVGSEGNICVDDASVEWADPLTASVHDEVICLPPTVRMEKDLDQDSVSIDDTTNLFLEIDPVSGDLECLTVYELVTNAGNDPDGVGAYEFQLKFDHKIFDITIEDSSWLSNGWTRTVNCTMTIISENDIRFGCVSSGPVPGQTADGTAAIITVCPEPDLVNRLTPGQENGVFRMLLDENCELADVLGDPLRIETGQLAPGVLPGGLLAVCSDMAITVRILEADLDLDCVVGLYDTQKIAFRYGAFFGNLLYDPWYDLEPALKDFDIDIKDLQKVFGRFGSTCAVPIPPQDPLPPPPW